jgi:RNA 2',3'-cyclic 3'-phosphodiesterase
MIRAFVAIDLPAGVHEALETLEAELRRCDAPVTWVKPERIHLTLKFLGNVSSEQIEGIQAVLRQCAASIRPFRLQAAGCGAFPTIQQMRVVWVGVRGDAEPLGKLQREVERALVPLGFPPEERPFRPHLTVGRVKGRQRLRLLQESLLASRGFEAEAFDVADLVLYKSELRPDGARYTPLLRAPFTGTSEEVGNGAEGGFRN